MEKYRIKLSAINEKLHKERFDINNEFINECLDFQIEDSILKLDVAIKKEGAREYELKCHIYGKINGVPCDLCTESLSLEINKLDTFIIKEANESIQSNDEIIFIQPGQKRLDITHLIFEMIILSIPLKRVHKLNKEGERLCDKEMLNLIQKYFKKKSIENDPRWDPLKKITY